ncbi:MAG: hypothetical protein IPP29_23020 [Bacteroidetes bacterium]|nr:hypothetical protein [Bacteroidota bacterium]
MYANIQNSTFAGKYATTDAQKQMLARYASGYLKFNFAMFGLDTTGTYTVTVMP